MSFDPITAGMELIGKAIDKFIPDPAAAAAAKLEMFKAEREGNMDELKVQMSAIIAEASSPDPWTSRARPSFLYVVYILLLMGIPVGLVGVFSPESALAFANGFKAWLTAIPESLYALFGVVMTGYGLQRTFEKVKGKA